jgi:hypothetical protein
MLWAALRPASGARRPWRLDYNDLAWFRREVIDVGSIKLGVLNAEEYGLKWLSGVCPWREKGFGFSLEKNVYGGIPVCNTPLHGPGVWELLMLDKKAGRQHFGRLLLLMSE